MLAAHAMQQRISRKGDCWDDPVSASFFATLEHELLADVDYRTRREAHLAAAARIETWYNVERRHSTLGNVSLVHYEAQLRQSLARAA
jgi:putative transposase